MVGRNYFREIKKLCTLKKLFPEINYSNLKGKIFFLGTTGLLLITVFRYESFLSVGPQGNSRTLEQGVKYVQS